MWLTDEEKQRHLRNLNYAKFDPDISIDKEFIPYLTRLNRIPWLVSIQSCSGHIMRNNEKCGHLGFRVKEPYFIGVVKICHDFMVNRLFKDASASIEIPYVCLNVWFSHHCFPYVVEKFVECLEQLDYERMNNENQLQ